jgi:CBS domain-containing protein
MAAGTQMAAIREVMTKELVTIEPASSVAAAVTVMGMRGVGAVLVIEEGRVEGIFTERDLVRALSSDIGAANHAVGQWMTRNPVTVGPEASVEEALEIMLNGHFRHLPVMEGERLVGVVSIRDLSRATLRE